VAGTEVTIMTAESSAGESSEGVFLDEPTTADLRAKVTEAWREFAGSLATVLAGLEPGAHIDLTLDPTASGTGLAVYSVSLRVLPDGVVEALAVGNAGLPEGYRMDRAAVADLVALGWSPPGVLPGSGDSFGLRSGQDKAGQLAAMVSRTLRDVYGAPHPAFLVYLVHDEEDEPIETGPLATARHEPGLDAGLDLAGLDEDGELKAALAGVADEVVPLEERVRTVVASMSKTTVDQLQVDTDGDIGIRAGSAMVFVRVRDNPPLVDVFSPILTEVEPTEQLYVKLSELTNRMPIGRLYCAQDTVWASIPVFGRNFQATHLMLAVQVMTGLADELDDRLHGEFGGKRFFGEGDKPVPAKEPNDEHRTGMYL
jgi:type III secretion system-like peptide-binding chaperone